MCSRAPHACRAAGYQRRIAAHRTNAGRKHFRPCGTIVGLAAITCHIGSASGRSSWRCPSHASPSRWRIRFRASAHDAVPAESKARARLADASAELVAVMGQAMMPLDVVRALGPGSILPLRRLKDGVPEVELRCGHQVLFSGAVVEHRGWRRFVIRQTGVSDERTEAARRRRLSKLPSAARQSQAHVRCRMPAGSVDFGVLRNVPMTVQVEVGRATMTLGEILDELEVGASIRLDRHAGDPVEVYVNGALFARAEVVVLQDQIGARILEVVGNGPGPDVPRDFASDGSHSAEQCRLRAARRRRRGFASARMRRGKWRTSLPRAGVEVLPLRIGPAPRCMSTSWARGPPAWRF